MPDTSTQKLTESQRDRVRLARRLAIEMVRGYHPANVFAGVVVDKAFELADRFYDEAQRRDGWR